jgi:aminoglycoside phosphotransferase (APT) family kinase protein
MAPIADRSDREFLHGRLDELRASFEQVRFGGPDVVLHGDASVGNVIVDQGVPKFIDLDGFCIGPREWDLLLTAMYHDRYGWHTREEYEAFCETYGTDVMESPHYQLLADVRELLMVTWIAQKATESEELAAEVSRRISDLRTGASRKGWKPY